MTPGQSESAKNINEGMITHLLNDDNEKSITFPFHRKKFLGQ